MKTLLLSLMFYALTVGQTFTGIASWYNVGPGGPTASGVPFDPTRMEAAHKTLPFGTVVKVTRLKTGKSISVVIVDRGPYIDGRIIDLTPAGAYSLDMVESGIAKVEVEILKIGPCRKYGCKFTRGKKI